MYIDEYVFQELGNTSWEYTRGDTLSNLSYHQIDHLMVINVQDTNSGKVVEILYDFSNMLNTSINIYSSRNSSRDSYLFFIDSIPIEYYNLIVHGINRYDEAYVSEIFQMGGISAIQDNLPDYEGKIVGVIGCGGGSSLAAYRSQRSGNITWPDCSDAIGTDCACAVGNWGCCCVTWYDC